MVSSQESLAALALALDGLRQGRVSCQAFSVHARSEDDLLTELPPRYRDVLHNLLDRLEASALFAEESCSFSQRDLIDSLQMWLDKAAGTLAAR